MYESSFRESFETDDEMDENSTDNTVTYKVCTIVSNFTVEDSDLEVTVDSVLLKLYDSLTPLDQFLLKCAAVLGGMVDRKLLEQLMQGTTQRDIGISLVKLFELRILGCAVGDFNRSSSPLMIFKKIYDPNINGRIRCGCRGITISKDLSDLPYYASCGLMRFKLDMFRETTYRLLTDYQKVEFHSKALRYLQQNTSRCASCAGGPFNRLLGESALTQMGKKRVSDLLTSTRVSLIGDSPDPIQNLNTTNEANYKSSSTSSLSWFKCNPIERSPTRTFSNMDFTNCECNLNLLTAYTQILAHCRGIGKRELLLVAIFEFVEVCLATLNIPQATRLLAEGDELIDSIYNSTENELIVLPYLKGKIHTLRGRCFLESGLITEALSCFETTMSIMGYKFPSNLIMIKLKSIYFLKQQMLMLTCLRNVMVGSLDGDAANYNDQFASCLTHMFIVYRLKGMHEHARLAAIWGLNTALESNKDFFVLCASYGNMIITAHTYRYQSLIQHLETHAINLCSQRQGLLELQELNAVSELYTRIFLSRLLRGLTDKAAQIGFVAARLAHTSRSIHLKLILLPRLIQLLIKECRYEEIVSMLQELEFICQNDMDQSSRTWYCALGIDLLLESGISIVTLRECEEFYQHESSKIMNLRDSESTKRFFICMWLWYVRIADWEAATVWRNRKCDDTILDEYTVSSAITALKKIEGLIILYVFKINTKNAKDAAVILSDIKETFKIIESIQKVVVVTNPRYLLMKAYYNVARFRTKVGLALLRNSKREACALRNILIYNWADHCEKSWTNSLSPIQQDLWKEQCAMGQHLNWQEVDVKNRKIFPYTLPVPKIHY